MAEERNVGLARASDSSAAADSDPTKAELQRRMEEARESITQTVTEIKDTVVTQYQQVRETISDSLDWREQYKRHTLPFTVGAFAGGALLGYAVMGAFKGGGDEEDYDTEDSFDRIEKGFDEGTRSYAASPVIGRARSASSSARRRTARPESNAATQSADAFGGGYSGESDADVGPSSRPSYSSGYNAATAQQAQGLTSYAQAPQAAQEEEEEPKGPGLIERFKETKAYDRLTDELSTVGERVVEELSRTAQTVVVPMLLNKLKSLIGVDLSGGRGGSRQSAVGSQASAPQSGGSQQNFTPSGAQGSASQPSSGSTGSASSAGGSSARAAGAGGTEGYGAS